MSDLVLLGPYQSGSLQYPTRATHPSHFTKSSTTTRKDSEKVCNSRSLGVLLPCGSQLYAPSLCRHAWVRRSWDGIPSEHSPSRSLSSMTTRSSQPIRTFTFSCTLRRAVHQPSIWRGCSFTSPEDVWPGFCSS